MVKYQIKENFLDNQLFINIKNLIINNKFAWFKKDYQTTKDKKIDLGYFSHSFFSNNTINSNYYNSHILDILKQLNAVSVLEVRANLTPSVFYLQKTSDFHCDFNLKYPTKTAILYLNTCNGGTEIKIDNNIIFVESKENKMLIFDSDIEHRGVTSTNADFRYIINFNYIKL